MNARTMACGTLALVFLIAACGGKTDAPTGTTPPVATTPGTTPSPTPTGTTATTNVICGATTASTLAHVHFEFPSDASDCVFTLAQAKGTVHIPYVIVVDEDVPGVRSVSLDDGGCGQPGPSGLIPFETLSGNGDAYCMCDVGLCAAPANTATTTLHAGRYAATFDWDGRNFGGPSDTSNPEGAPFPVGDYVLHVDAKGTVTSGAASQPYELTAAFPIHLIAGN